MSTTLKFRRATTSAMGSITGEVAELFVDTSKNTVVVHDGSTAGGTPLATESYAISYASPILGGNLDTNGRNIDAGTSPLTITAGSDLSLNSTSGELILNGFYWPGSDGTEGQVLVTDGNGNLSWADGGIGGGGGTTTLGDDESLTFGADDDLAVTYNSVADNVSFDLKVPVIFSQVNTGDKLSINTNDVTFHDEVIIEDEITFSTGNVAFASTGIYSTGSTINVLNTSTGGIVIRTTGTGSSSGIHLDCRLSDGDLKFNNVYFPRNDGIAGQVLTTNGSGQLSWSTGGSGGATGYFYDSGDGSITITEDNGANIEMINGDIFLRSNSASDYVYIDGFRFDGDSGWFNGGILRSNSSKQLYWEALNMNALIDVDMAFTPNDNDILQYNSSTSMWEAVSAPSVTGMSNVVEDITPQLGGDLDTNGNSITVTNDELIQFGGTYRSSIKYDSGAGSNSAGTYLNAASGQNLFLSTGTSTSSTPRITINDSVGVTFNTGGFNSDVVFETTSTFDAVATFNERSVHTAGIAIDGELDDDDINFNSGEFIIGKYSFPADGYFLEASATNIRLQSTNNDIIIVSGSGTGDKTVIRRGATVVGSFNENGLTIGDTYTIPYTDGNANEVLATDGSGNISWTSLTAITGPEGYDYTAGAITITSASGNNLTLDPGTGDLVLDYSIWPPTEGTSNQVLTTDGNGNLSWTDKGEGGSGSLPSRGEVTGATSSIADNATDNIEISAFKAYHLLAIETDVDAWVRIYTTAAARTADATRSEGVDPLPGSGVLAEARIDGVQVMTPPAVGFNFDTPVATTVYVAVTNRSGSTTAVNVTLNIIQIEA